MSRSDAVRELGLDSGAGRARKQLAELAAGMRGEPELAPEFEVMLKEQAERAHIAMWRGVQEATRIHHEVILDLLPPEPESAV